MRIVFVTLICLLAVGCRSDLRCQRETALLRAEILDLEDKYYALKSQSDSGGEPYYEGTVYEGDVVYEGEVFQDGMVYPEETIYEGEVIYQGIPIEGGVFENAPMSQSNPAARLNSIPVGNGSELNAPSVMEPQPGSDAINLNIEMPRDTGNLEALPLSNDTGQSRIMTNSAEFASAGADAFVTEIFISPSVTRGRDIDGVPGDEGIDLLVQPRTSNGRIEFQAGELTVSLIDPAESPARQRVGLWKFLPEETKLFFADDSETRGILLHLPWDQSAPVNDKLVLHVRFVTADSRVLKTSGRIRINPPADNYSPDDPLVANWTQSDPRWKNELDAPVTTQRTRRQPAVRISTNRNLKTEPPRSEFPSQAEIEKPAWRPIR